MSSHELTWLQLEHTELMAPPGQSMVENERFMGIREGLGLVLRSGLGFPGVFQPSKPRLS